MTNWFAEAKTVSDLMMSEHGCNALSEEDLAALASELSYLKPDGGNYEVRFFAHTGKGGGRPSEVEKEYARARKAIDTLARIATSDEAVANDVIFALDGTMAKGRRVKEWIALAPDVRDFIQCWPLEVSTASKVEYRTVVIGGRLPSVFSALYHGQMMGDWHDDDQLGPGYSFICHCATALGFGGVRGEHIRDAGRNSQAKELFSALEKLGGDG